jgi:hypothetical protein
MADRAAKTSRRRRRGKVGNEHRSTWIVRSSPYGRATMLVGTIDTTMVAALVAPGTRHEREDGTVTRDGWRFAYWEGMSAEDVAIDEELPKYVFEHDLRDVVDLVSERCEQHLDWVRDRLDDRISALAAGLRSDHHGTVPAGADYRENGVRDLLDTIRTVIPEHLEEIPDSPLRWEWYTELCARVNRYARSDITAR